MPFVFAVIGALLGATMAGATGALIGLVAGPALLLLLRQLGKSDSPEVSTLALRIQALELEVGALKAQVQRLMQADAPAPAAAEPAWAELVRPAAPAPLEAAPTTPAETPASSETAQPLRPAAAPIAAAVPAAITAAIPAPARAAPPAPAADAAAAMTPPPARPARPPRPPVAPPSPPLRDRLPPFVSRFVFGGNTIVKVGVLILFLGLAFLLRYAAERVTVPIELRYAGVALVGAFMLGLGWRLRDRRDAAGGHGYGLILQGAGIGVFYLTALAAIKLHPLLPPSLAFVFMALVALLGALLAVAQDAPWLALIAIAEGFAAPVLVSTGGGNHIALFSYLAILDIGIFLMAWFKAWRPLNLVGAVSTFALAGAWAQRSYDDSKYAGVQAFLILFFLLFTGIGVLFARRALAQGDAPDTRKPLATRAAQALALVGRVDSTLTFGVPLAAFGLQYLLVRGDEWGPAWSAFGFALFYLLLGGALLRGRNPRYSLLGEAYVIVSVIFGTLTIPLALEGVWTGATWAIEAAGMYWLGARQQRVYARAFALVVLAGAMVRLVTELGIDLQPGTPLVTGSVLGIAMLAASALAFVLVQRRIASHQQGSLEMLTAVLMPLLVVASVDTIAWMTCTPLWAGVISAWLAFACAASQGRLAAPVLQLAALVLHALALTSLGLTLQPVEGAAMLASGWKGLSAAVLIGSALLATGWLPLRAQLQAADARAGAPAWSLASGIGLLAGLAVLNLSLLFVMRADRAALIWPWVGLAALWVSLRVAHPALALGGVALQIVAAVATLIHGPTLWPASAAATHAGPLLWGPLTLSIAAFIGGDLVQRSAAATQRRNLWPRLSWLQWGIVLWALAWWSQVLPPELHRELLLNNRLSQLPNQLVGWLLMSSMLMLMAARWRDWRVLGQATWLTVPLWVLLAVVGPLESGRAPSAELGWLMWPLAFAWHWLLLRGQTRWLSTAGLQPLHVIGFWLFVLLGARECQLWMQSWGDPGSAWPALGWMLVPALVLTVITRPALLQRWPLRDFRMSYLGIACAPLLLYLLLWLWWGNSLSGAAAPLPYVPLLNPLEMAQALVLLALFLWLRALPDDLQQRLPRPLLLGGLGITAFALYTGMVLRICHHWAGVVWDGSALFESTLTQAALSVAWSAIGVGMMLLGHRKVQRIVWAVGAGLLAVVVAKLFLVELADRGGLYRIVSFIVVGVLLLLVGYFAPVPPNRSAATASRA